MPGSAGTRVKPVPVSTSLVLGRRDHGNGGEGIEHQQTGPQSKSHNVGEVTGRGKERDARAVKKGTGEVVPSCPLEANGEGGEKSQEG
jgi:hypothetical protein